MKRFVSAVFIFALSIAPSLSFCNVQVCDADLDVYTSTALQLYAIKHKLSLTNSIAEIALKLYGKKDAEDVLNVEYSMRQACKNALEDKDNTLKFYARVLKEFSPQEDLVEIPTRSEKISRYANATYRTFTESPALRKALRIGEVVVIVFLFLAVIGLAQKVAELDDKANLMTMGMNFNTVSFAQQLTEHSQAISKHSQTIDEHRDAINDVATLAQRTHNKIKQTSGASRFLGFITNVLLFSWLTSPQGSGGGSQGGARATL